MRVLLIDPDQQSREIIDLSGDPLLWQYTLSKFLIYDPYYVPDSSKTMHLIVDRKCYKGDRLGVKIPGLTYPLFGKTILTGWNDKLKLLLSIPLNFNPEEFQVYFLNKEESEKEKAATVQSMFDFWEENN